MQVDGDEALTPSQAASLLPNTSVDSIRRWIRSGALPAQKLPNGRYFVRRGDVEALLSPALPSTSSSATSSDPSVDGVLPGQGALL
ncbi:hypothetical protein BKH27_06835 [Actinomyces oris]|uniref:Helix-turn-helix domain-containing protein n=1 Tax=Actinomyces oris TaxID=544580 RepID=A0A1Q8VY56_9ACTO|nr:hypothetical protein BKH27_06835 [Actinomyces oris]